MYKKLQTKCMLLLALLLMGASSGWADQTVFYTLTPANGTNNSYTGNCDVTIDGITWNITGNSQMQPWRIGGKSITNVDRSVYSKTAMGSAITKVDLTVGAASSITVNSLKLIVASDADFNNKLDEVSATFAANSTITFSPTSGSEWATGAYYKFTFNVTVSVSSNKFVEFTKAEFYAEGGDTHTPTVAAPTFSPAAGEVDYGTSVSITQASAYMINYTVDGSDPTWENGKDIDTNPITITSDVTIKARAYDRDQNASEIVTAAYTVKRPDAPTFSPAAGAVEQGTTVTISGRPTNGRIIYTTDGTDPSYSNNSGTVYTDEEITINEAMTIKAIAVDAHNFESSIASASYTIYDPNAPGAVNNPYTVSDAIDVIEALTTTSATTEKYYVKGIVSSFQGESIIGDGVNYRYYVSDDGSTDNQLLVYKGNNLNNEAFASADELQLGDEVVVYGPFQYYNSRTPEIAAGNYIVSLKRKAENAINGLNDTYTIDMTQEQYELTFNATATSGATVQYEVVEEGTTVSEDDYLLEGNVLTVMAKGTVVIRAFVDANEEYKAAEKTTTVTVLGEKDDAVIVVEDESVAYGSTFTLDTSMIEGGDITLTSSNTAVATVEGLVVTPQAVGTTTITVETAENDLYKAGSETFTLTVTAPEGQTTAPSTSSTVLFNETFDQSDGTGGRDNAFSGNVGTSSLTGKTDEEWATIGSNGASHCIKLGTGKAQGVVTTSEITVSGSVTLSFEAAGWGDENENVVSVSVAGGTINGETSVDITLTNGEWTSYSYPIVPTETEIQITFSMKRGFLDEVKVEQPAEAAPKLTLSASGYASYCYQYPLDFSNIDKDTFKAWYVSGVDMANGNVTFTEITGTIKGGEGFFLYGTPGAECQLAFASSSTTELNDNELEGTLAPTYVENDELIQNYGLSGGNFVKMGNGVVKANKAYLPVLKEGETPAKMNIIFESEEATGIKNITTMMQNGDAYDLQGRKVMNPTKGIYVVNGKKVILK